MILYDCISLGLGLVMEYFFPPASISVSTLGLSNKYPFQYLKNGFSYLMNYESVALGKTERHEYTNRA